jgi:hypothetical protein
MIVLAMDVVNYNTSAVRRHRQPIFAAQGALRILVAALPMFAHRGAEKFVVLARFNLRHDPFVASMGTCFQRTAWRLRVICGGSMVAAPCPLAPCGAVLKVVPTSRGGGGMRPGPALWEERRYP